MKRWLDFLKMKEKKERAVMLTAYDYPSARLVKQAEVDIPLVDDVKGHSYIVGISQLNELYGGKSS